MFLGGNGYYSHPFSDHIDILSCTSDSAKWTPLISRLFEVTHGVSQNSVLSNESTSCLLINIRLLIEGCGFGVGWAYFSVIKTHLKWARLGMRLGCYDYMQELLKEQSYDEKSDLWSLGCLIYELCALVPPFLAPNQKILAIRIKLGHYKRIPAQYSTNLQTAIASLIQTEVRSRSSLLSMCGTLIVHHILCLALPAS